MNLKFSTPLDVLLESRPEYGDLVLGEMIRAADGKTAAEVLSNSEPVLGGSPPSGSSNPTPHPRTSLQQSHHLGTRDDTEEATPELLKQEKENKYHPDILLLVATLVATVSFQAALNPPGGFEPDDDDHKNTKGQAVLGDDSLSLFLLFDMFSLFSSVSVILLFLCVVPRKRKIVIKFLVWVMWCASFSMGLAFTVGTNAIYNEGPSTKTLLRGWFAVLRLGISWVLFRLVLFLLKKSRLWKPILRMFAKVKKGFSLLNNRTKNSCSKKCCGLLNSVCCILSIIFVLGIISLIWASYKLIDM